MMKKLLILCLCATLCLSCACAELSAPAAEEPAAEEAASGETLSLTAAAPIDVTSYTVYGAAPSEDGFTENGYADDSIVVEMSRVWVNDACYNVAHVWVADASQLRTALAGKLGKKTNYVWNIAKNANAVVAIGGEDLAENTGTYTVRQTVVERKKGYAKRDTLMIDQNGDFHVTDGFSKDTLDAWTAEGLQAINLFNFGPVLVENGVAREISKDYGVGNVTAREPRTAIGQVGPLEYIMVVVDGRNVKDPAEDGSLKESLGSSMQTVANFMAEQGCVAAYALDGGGSAVMYFHGEAYSNPSSKRGVSDIVYFATAVGE